MIEIFYNYILPPITLLSFLYIIYLLLSKKFYYELIEQEFHDAIDNNRKISKNAIQEHFTKMQERTAEMLEKINNEVQEQLERSMKQAYKFDEQLSQIVYNQHILNIDLADLKQSNTELHNEIKKRDAIIERKTKQIKRLKNAV